MVMARTVHTSLGRTIPLFMALAIAGFSLLQVVSATLVVRARFSVLEVQDIEGRRNQFRTILENDAEGLERLVKSYAEWLPTFEFAESGDPVYIESNYNRQWLASQDIDAVMIISAEGKILWTSAGTFGIPSLSETGSTKPGDPLLFPRDFGSLPPTPLRGFIAYGNVAMLYVSWPITDDLNTRVPNGILVFGRMLDQATFDSFSQGDEFSVAFVPASVPLQVAMLGASVERAVLKADATEGYSIAKDALGKTRLAAYDAILDPAGRLVGYWKFCLSREWTRTASALVHWLAVLAAIAGAGVYAVSSLIIHRRMVRPILSIRNHLDVFADTLAIPARLEAVHRDEIGELAGHVNSLVDRILVQTKELDRLAGTDGLTGLANRRKLDAILDELAKKNRSARSRPDERGSTKHGLIACGLLDVDYFKAYNDLYGHGAGDEALMAIAQVIQSGAKRPGDLASRYGGEEFVVVLPDTDEAGAMEVLERIRQSVQNLGIAHEGSNVAGVVTISGGVAVLDDFNDDTSPKALLKAADRALYAAKSSGRNRVIAASTLLL